MFVPLITIALFVITKNHHHHHHHHHLPAHDLDLLKIFQTDGFWMEEIQTHTNPFFKTMIMISIIKDVYFTVTTTVSFFVKIMVIVKEVDRQMMRIIMTIFYNFGIVGNEKKKSSKLLEFFKSVTADVWELA